MYKILLLSLLGFALFGPIVAARSNHPRRSLRRLALLVALFNILYVVLVIIVLPRLRG